MGWLKGVRVLQPLHADTGREAGARTTTSMVEETRMTLWRSQLASNSQAPKYAKWVLSRIFLTLNPTPNHNPAHHQHRQARQRMADSLCLSEAVPLTLHAWSAHAPLCAGGPHQPMLAAL